MRVRISYGVDIKDVPKKVSDLLYDSLGELDKAREMLARVVDDLENCEENITHALSTVDRVRQKLGSTDLNLTDAQSIMSGLEEYYNGEQNVSDGRPTMDTSGNVVAETENTGEG